MIVFAAITATACGSDDDGASPPADSSATEGESSAVESDCAPARAVPAGSQTRTINHNEVPRDYRLTIPESYDGETAAPLVVNLHGLSSTAEQQDVFSNLPQAGGQRGYVVVSPQGLDTTLPLGEGGLTTSFWNVAPTVDTSEVDTSDLQAADDLGFVATLLDELEGELCVDVDREYAAGMSNGAAMTVALFCTYPDRFAAAAPVAGANFVSDCDAPTATPTVAFHGDADVLAPYEGGDVFGFPLGLPAAQDQMADFALLGGCDPAPEETEIGEDVVLRTWVGCPDGLTLQLYTVLGGGHTWPGVTTYIDAGEFEGAEERDEVETTVFGFSVDEILGHQTETIVATELILDFFDDHTRPG